MAWKRSGVRFSLAPPRNPRSQAWGFVVVGFVGLTFETSSGAWSDPGMKPNQTTPVRSCTSRAGARMPTRSRDRMHATVQQVAMKKEQAVVLAAGIGWIIF